MNQVQKIPEDTYYVDWSKEEDFDNEEDFDEEDFDEEDDLILDELIPDGEEEESVDLAD